MKRPRPFDERSFETLHKRAFKLTAPKSHPEDDLHASVAEALDWGLVRPALYTTFPAGWGKLPKATAGRLKRLGMKAGFPDILAFYDGRCVGIELKAGTSASTSQREMHALLKAAGINVYICRSIEEVMVVLRAEEFPVRFAFKDTKGLESWLKSSGGKRNGQGSSGSRWRNF